MQKEKTRKLTVIMYICSPFWKDQRICGTNGKDNSVKHSMIACSVHTEPAYALRDLTTYFLPVSRLVHVFPLFAPSFGSGSALSNSKSESVAVGYESTVQQQEKTFEWFDHSRREQGLIRSLLVWLIRVKDALEILLWFPATRKGESPVRKGGMLSHLDSIVMPFGINISNIREVL